MFKQIMSLLSSGKTYTEQEMAKELGVSLETLRGFMEYLTNIGVLSKVEMGANKPSCHQKGGCPAGCKGCGSKPFSGQTPVLWELKDKTGI